MSRCPTLSPMLAVLALGGLLIACEQPEDQTAGQRLDETVAKTEQAGAELKADAKQLGEQAKQAAADLAISTRVKAALATDGQLSAMAIEVDTLNGVVLLHGSAPDASAQQRATQLAQAIDGVRGVDNRLIVQAKG